MIGVQSSQNLQPQRAGAVAIADDFDSRRPSDHSSVLQAIQPKYRDSGPLHA